MLTIEDVIERFDGSLAYSTNSKEICQYIADLLKELKERRKAPEIIFCHECRYWKDSDGVYRRGINAESKCPVNSRQVYEGTFFCGMAERRTDGEKQSD